MQMEGLFDVPPSQKTGERWDVTLDLPSAWNVGLIVGPSGSGKTTIARQLWPGALCSGFSWPEDKSLLDGFPFSMGIKDVVELLCSVGFSSPPSWVHPFRVLSNGEQFRVNIARVLAEQPELAVVDEFTSVVDRTVAQIASAAIQKTVRRRNQKFIAVSCHYDIADWLEPDWVYEPHNNAFYSGRYLHQRPKIELTIRRVHSGAWQLFRKHHYLSGDINTSARCFAAFIGDVPVALCAWLPIVHHIRGMRRCHRLVTLPDYQGVGIGMATLGYLASVASGAGFAPSITSSHPGIIRSLNASKVWEMTSAPKRHENDGKARRDKKLSRTTSRGRLVAAFRYVGPRIARGEADALWYAGQNSSEALP